MATRMIDIALMESGTGEDLAVSAGDFAAVESTAMHQRQLIVDKPGDLKFDPIVGVGAFDFIQDDGGLGELARVIAKEFSQDGMDVIGVSVGTNGVVNSDAFYP